MSGFVPRCYFLEVLCAMALRSQFPLVGNTKSAHPENLKNYNIRYCPKGVLPQRCSAHFWRNFDAFLTHFGTFLFSPIKPDPFWRIFDSILTHFWRTLAIADTFSENAFWTIPKFGPPQIPVLPFLVFFFENGKETPPPQKETRIFYPYRTPKTSFPWKWREKRSNTKEFVAGQKKQGIPPKTTLRA